jgi:hypothetical protein
MGFVSGGQVLADRSLASSAATTSATSQATAATANAVIEAADWPIAVPGGNA